MKKKRNANAIIFAVLDLLCNTVPLLFNTKLIFLFSATFPHYLAAGLQQPAMYGYGAAGAAVGAAGAAGAAPAATQGLQGRGT